MQSCLENSSVIQEHPGCQPHLLGGLSPLEQLALDGANRCLFGSTMMLKAEVSETSLYMSLWSRDPASRPLFQEIPPCAEQPCTLEDN